MTQRVAVDFRHGYAVTRGTTEIGLTDLIICSTWLGRLLPARCRASRGELILSTRRPSNHRWVMIQRHHEEPYVIIREFGGSIKRRLPAWRTWQDRLCPLYWTLYRKLQQFADGELVYIWLQVPSTK